MLADAFRAGEIGIDQMDLIARIHRNARVRTMLIDAQTSPAAPADYSVMVDRPPPTGITAPVT